MKTYCYNEPGAPELVYKTEDEILELYWHYWRHRMIRKFGEHSSFITKENCIADWCSMHGAWEA